MTIAWPTIDARVWRIAIAAVIGAAILFLSRTPLHTASPIAHAPAMLTPTPAALPPSLPQDDAPLPIGPDAARLSNAQVPIADVTPAIAAPYRFVGDEAARLRARDCLAAAAWYEAGDDPPGERAVVQVVLNRARHPAFPHSVCAVVFQGSERATGCQFTFTCDGALARVPAPAALLRSRAIADAALAGAVDPLVGLATHYHADYVVPRWRDGLVKIARQGAHLFYRWPGYWGSAAAMARVAKGDAEPVEPALARIASDIPAEDAGTVVPVPLAPQTVVNIAPPPPGDALELRLDPAAPPGSYALRALDACGKASTCRVAGRVAQDLAFLYVRKPGGSGAEGAYWDCTRYRRADAAQCLPSGAALQRLLAS